MLSVGFIPRETPEQAVNPQNSDEGVWGRERLSLPQ